MMKVYIVFEHQRHEGMYIRAVFDTEKKAKDYIHDNEPDDDVFFWLEWDEYEVE